MTLSEIEVPKLKISNTLLLVLMRFCIDAIYLFFVVNSYGYYGFGLDFNLLRYIISLCITFVYAFLADYVLHQDDFISNIVYFLILLYFIPGETVFSFNPRLDLFHVYVVLYFCVLFFFYCLYEKTSGFVTNYSIGKLFGKKTAVMIITFLSLVLLFLSYRWAQFRLFVRIDDVYKFRLNARLLDIPSILRYFRSWFSIVIPFFFVYSVIKKRYLFSFVLLFLQLLDFGFDGQKIILFRIPFEIVVAFFYNRDRRPLIPSMLTLVCFGSAVVCLIRGSSLIGDYIIRRIMILPTLLGGYAFDFFSTHSPDFLRSSFLRHFGFVSPYAEQGGIPRIIGLTYFNSTDMAADVGLAGDAFSQFGWFGLFIFPVLLVMMLGLMSSVSKKADRKLVMIISFIFALIFIDTSFFTVMLTDGYILVVILFLLIGQQVAEEENTP